MSWLIYKFKNKTKSILLNKNKEYIGLTKNFDQRLIAHNQVSKNSNYSNYNHPFYKAIRKYGINNFDVEFIEENIQSIEKANEREKYWIKEYQTKIPNGYNLASGGGGNPGFSKNMKEGKTTDKIKWCPGCSQSKNRSEFNKTKNKCDGLESACRGCKRIAKNKRIARRRNLGLYIKRENKICYQCKENKNINEFGVNTLKLDGKDIRCKTCKNAKRSASPKKLLDKSKLDLNAPRSCGGKCGKIKTINDFFISKYKILSMCKICHSEDQKRRNEEIKNSEKIIIISKICTGCKEDKLAKEYGVCNNKKDGLMIKCRICVNKEYTDNQLKKAVKIN